MRTQLAPRQALWLILLASMPAARASEPQSAPAPPQAVAAGETGKIVSLSVQTGGLEEGLIRLAGRDAGQQLLVNGVDERGEVHDVTRRAQFEAVPADLVAVDATGYVVPLTEGEATLRISVPHAAAAAEVRVSVTNIREDLPVHFADQIVPIFTKYSCNSGGCHGKSSGQNGFRLSLLGFEPGEDFEHLVREGRGRRLFPAAPERSLLLLKATAQLPHGGGERITPESPAYRLLRRWIEQGMPLGRPDAPLLSRIELFPERAAPWAEPIPAARGHRALHRWLDARRDPHDAARLERSGDGRGLADRPGNNRTIGG